MISNYFKVALRNIKRHSFYSIINVSGLALGISCAILIFSLVTYHLSFDNFHAHSDRIYRFVTEMHRDQVSYRSSVPNPFGKVVRDEYTFSEKVARRVTLTDQLITIENNSETKKIKEEIAFVEEDFFDIFNFPLIAGDKNTALKEPRTAIITKDVALKYFGTENAIDKIFRLDNRIDFKITGILKDIPENTDTQTEIYLSYNTLKEFNEDMAKEDSWGGISSDMQCFVRLKPGVNSSEVEALLPALVKKYRPGNKNVHHYKLQPLNDIHFNVQYGASMEKRNLWVLSFIGFFLVVTASVNFINLATAQAVHRAKEVGVRKVLGSIRHQLFWQFMVETGVITIIATIIAFVIANLVLPYVNQWFDAQISLHIFSDGKLWMFISALVIMVTLFSGAYPGLILSGFKPIAALKGKLSQQTLGGIKLRRALIITQFSISQVLIIGVIVIVYQMKYASESDMGFDKEAVVMVPLGSKNEKMKTLNAQLQQIPGVENSSLCFDPPAALGAWRTSFLYDNRSEEEIFSFNYKGGDDHYLSTFDLKLIAGRNLLPSDTTKEFLVNEMLIKKLNLKSAEDILGHTITTNGGDWTGPVVGVIKDFHNGSFYEEITPIFISSSVDDYNYYAIKINTASMRETLAAIEKAWSATYPEQLYDYEFLDDQIKEFYETENTMMNLIQVFSLIAIFIGCMGLYGLVSFMATQKTKEIGIRKVLGGSVSQILWIFGKEFSGLIAIAFLVAAPLGWWLMNDWLNNFKYRINIGVWVYLLAVSITAVVALLTVGYRSVKASLMNPVDSLRAE